MDRLVNTALTAMRGAMARQASIANNLANANTVGFRAEIANAETRWIQGDSFDTRAQASEQVIAADILEIGVHAAERLGLSHTNIVSGAGHDACWINRVAPTAMVMCPCVDGLSHNEAEEITREWAKNGANVLMHAVVETAGVAE